MNIMDIINKLELNEDEYELYGKDKAKLNINRNESKGKLILVTSTNPTPYGEGKTTLNIGLTDSLNKLGYKTISTLREPSLGPVFGVKGGATGGGKAIVLPQEDINLHFTGDFHAVTSANNLLSAIIDNHIFQGNELGIDKVVFNRCLDINDRALRKVEVQNRTDKFDITPASEIMAILCLSKDINDLKNRLSKIIVGYTKEGDRIYVSDLHCEDALTILLKNAIKPNLVSTLYNNPCIIHGGPFANIAHGCNTIIATKTALSLADFVVTEAGFGSDCGALKFFDIKARLNDLNPICVVVNTTIKALKYNGNDNLEKGIDNLKFHIENMKKYNDNVIVSLNKFDDDIEEDIEYVRNYCDNLNTKFVISTMYKDGEDGCLDLAKAVVNLENTKHFEAYNLDDDLQTKIEKVCALYNCHNIEYKCLDKIKNIHDKYPICIAKTPMSITDDPKKLGYPTDYTMTVTDVKVQNGAGFIVVYMGNIMTMPGLAKHSKYLDMHI